MVGLYLIQDFSLHLSAFVQALKYVTQNIKKMSKQLVKRKRVNLRMIEKRSFEWRRREEAMTKKQFFGWQILFAKIKGVNLASLR